ncbi:chemotaxis protein CheW [Thermospira aquatica]|uniref:Chemotaxis protein CheW n=1 Tax=Thermospira aquatica TaxID=2828656 RepID=A0AAX3BDG3_9SPIR|nr:chemotaxis protein CheW [Thermospira aquatica]URA10364.1 purine-binding chemotaxis protein CheW [Thermospira aquatica]
MSGIYEEELVDMGEEEDTISNKYLTFTLGDNSYGIPIAHIRDIIEMQKIATIPDMPPYVRGVINLRGKIIPVVDMRLRLHMPFREYDDRTCIIVIELKNTLIGLIVDVVEEVLEILPNNIEVTPHFRGIEAQERYIKGIGKVGDKLKILLDVEKVVYEDDLKTLQEAGEA